MIYLNYYRCERGHEWTDEWDCTCDDECPTCGGGNYTPVKSEIVGPGYVDHAGNMVHLEDGFETVIAEDADGEEPGDLVHRVTLENLEDAVRLVLGDPGEKDAPSLYIQRRGDHWRVFVHPHSGDPAVVVYVHDNKRVEVQVEESCKTLSVEVN